MNSITTPTTLAKDPTSMRVLSAAQRAWVAASALRQRRNRYKRFTYGDQWSDIIETPEGQHLSEGDYARKKGKRPMTNNLIRKLVKCIIGRFRLSLDDEHVSDLVAKLRRLNSLDELDSRTLEEFLISGCAIQRIVSENRTQGRGVWVDQVSPERFFVNSVRDPRGWDTELIGMLHDMSVAELTMRFAQGDPTRAAALRSLYANSSFDGSTPLGAASTMQFLTAEPGRCRVIEVWTLQAGESLLCHDPENATVSRCDVGDIQRLEQTNASDIGARELLTLQMQMFEDVSGVSNALMGKTDSSNVGVNRYESQVRDATVAINDLLHSFGSFRSQRDQKMLQCAAREAKDQAQW